MHSHPTRRRLRAAAAVVATVATVAGLSIAGVSSAEAAGRVTFAGSVPAFAKQAKTVGAASANTIYQGQIFLNLQTPSDAPTAEALARAVSTPGSASYRQYVSPSNWIATYSPTQATVNSQITSLLNAGIKQSTIQVPSSRLYVVFRGTEEQIDKAFSTKLATYEVDGTDIVAPSVAPSLPSDVAAHVSGIVLDQSRFQTRPKNVTQASEAANASTLTSAVTALLAPKVVTINTPCSGYTNQVTVTAPSAYHQTRFGTANCGYTPSQLRAVYKVPGGTTAGTGQTVAVVDAYASPTTAVDVSTYSRGVGETGFVAGQYSDITPSRTTYTDQAACGGVAGWQVEQTLDIEAVHGMAPGSNVLYAGGSDCGAGLDLAVSRVLDGNTTTGGTAGTAPLANIISNSYGGSGEPDYGMTGATNYVQGELSVQMQAAAEGVGLYFASGDNGDERINTGAVQADFPASSPWVTAVGGTSLGISKTNSKVYELGWGDLLDPIVPAVHHKLRYNVATPGTLFGGGAGGGKSALFTRGSASSDAWYQTYPVVPAIGGRQRLVPDVAALADPYTGFLVGVRDLSNKGKYTLLTVGGTSLATPIVAAQMAVIQQQTGAQVGFANPTLYSLAASTPATFTDVVPRGGPVGLVYSNATSTALVTLDHDGTLVTKKGYDTVTGLGGLNLSQIAGFETVVAP